LGRNWLKIAITVWKEGEDKMEHLMLEAEVREKAGKGIARGLRREGFIPAVLYGIKEKTVSLQVNEKDFENVKRDGGEHAVIDLRVGHAATPAVVKEEQFDPVLGKLLHVDFLRVSLTEKMRSMVPLATVGEAAGEKAGGIVEHIMREVEVECLPDRIPENIEIDVTHLEIGDSLRVQDLTAPEVVEIVTEPGRVIISVLPPRVVEEEVEKEEAAEPELIGEKEKAEEGAEEKAEEGKGKEGKEEKKEK
jgi:large subunit ribosomal protein L25